MKVARPVRRAGQGNPPRRKAGRAPWPDPYTYVRSWAGFVYVAFILDVFAQKIVAWHAATNKRTGLVLTPLRMALWDRDRHGHPVAAGELVHHHDAGSQTGLNRWSQHRLVGPTLVARRRPRRVSSSRGSCVADC